MTAGDGAIREDACTEGTTAGNQPEGVWTSPAARGLEDILPTEAIEAACRANEDHDGGGRAWWDEYDETAKDECRRAMRAAIAAYLTSTSRDGSIGAAFLAAAGRSSLTGEELVQRYEDVPRSLPQGGHS